METIKKIEQLIDHYENHFDKMSIDGLLNMSDKFAILNCRLGDIMVDYSHTYLKTYLDRKLMNAGLKIGFQSSGDSNAKATDKAQLQIKGVKDKEISHEIDFMYVKEKRRSVEKLLQSIQQRISYLKQEKNRMNNLGNNQNQK